jgi:hypothetical protein
MGSWSATTGGFLTGQTIQVNAGVGFYWGP